MGDYKGIIESGAWLDRTKWWLSSKEQTALIPQVECAEYKRLQATLAAAGINTQLSDTGSMSLKLHLEEHDYAEIRFVPRNSCYVTDINVTFPGIYDKHWAHPRYTKSFKYDFESHIPAKSCIKALQQQLAKRLASLEEIRKRKEVALLTQDKAEDIFIKAGYKITKRFGSFTVELDGKNFPINLADTSASIKVTIAMDFDIVPSVLQALSSLTQLGAKLY